MKKSAIATLVLAIFGCVLATAAIAQVTVHGGIVTYTVPPARAGAAVDYVNAKPLPMPVADIPPMSQSEAIRHAPDPLMLYGTPKFLPGSVGSGKEDPIQLAPPKPLQQKDAIVPEEFTPDDLPYTTSRVNAENDYTAQYSPFRAAGKLFITKAGASSTCSASLIQRGLVVTAAHCVVDYGTRNFAKSAEFVPAWNNGTAPYGKSEVSNFVVPLRYVNGTDCDAKGVICADDIAILTLRNFLGDSTGYFGVGYDGYGFTAAGQALIDQLGYPGALDSGQLMERNDSQGSISGADFNNTIIGSLLTHGASGGPWVVNLGVTPTPSPFLRLGSNAAPLVVGVSSFITTRKIGIGDLIQVVRAGASPFRVTNVQAFIIEACAKTPDACKCTLKSCD